jgi:hypothetical protein
MRIVAGRTKAGCRVVFIKSGVHSRGDKGYVRFWHKADNPGTEREALTLGSAGEMLWIVAAS